MQQSNRFFLISWLLVPIVLVWLSTNYLLGLNRKTQWQVNSSTPDEIQNVLGETTNEPVDTEVERIKWDGKAMLSLGFDDAWSSQYAIAYPILKEMGIKGAIAVPTQIIGMDGYMSWSQIKILSRDGWEVVAHSRTHSCETDKMTGDFLINEMVGSKEDLQRRGFAAQNYVSPCGAESPEIKAIAKDNYLSLRGTEGGFNPLPVADSYSLKIHALEWNTTPEEVGEWIAEAQQYNVWLLIVFHQIQDNQADYAVTRDNFLKMMEIVRDSGIRVVLPIQAMHLDISEALNSPTPASSTVSIASGTFVNIHPVAEVASETIARMEFGQSYKVVESGQDWVRIEYEPGQSGWVLKRLIKEDNQ